MTAASRPAPPAGSLVRVAALAAVVLHLLVLYVPTAPSPSDVSLPPWTDLVVHAAVFALVTALGIAAWPHRTRLVTLLAALHAPVSELMQHALYAHRTGDPRDVAADLLGVVLGALAGWALARWLSAPRAGTGRDR